MWRNHIQPGLDDCLNMLLACFRKKMSAQGQGPDRQEVRHQGEAQPRLRVRPLPDAGAVDQVPAAPHADPLLDGHRAHHHTGRDTCSKFISE